MVKKLLLLSPVVLGLVFFGMATDQSSPDVSAQLKQAQVYQTNGQYQQAMEIYQQIAADYPGTGDALQAQEKLTCLYVTLGKELEAQAALEKLKANFSSFAQQEQVSLAVTHVGDAYRNLGKHEKACKVYSYVIANWPGADSVLWSQMGYAISELRLRNYASADAAVDKLHADFSKDQRISIAACLIADEYRRLNEHDKADQLYQYVLDNWPDAEHALWSRMGLAISSLLRGDYDAANSSASKLQSDFSKDQRISVAACLIADEYRRSNKYQQACELYQYAVDNWPNAEHSLWSQMGLAISNLYLGQDPNTAIDKLCANFATDGRLTIALCTVADEYRRLERYERAIQLYQYVVDSWPDAEFALWSQMDIVLSAIGLTDDAGVEAAIAKLLSAFSGSKGLTHAINNIAWHYRRLERYEKANQVYQSAIDVLSKGPQTTEAVWSQVALIISNIALGNDIEAQAATDSLVTSLDDNVILVQVIDLIGDAYYEQALFEESHGQQERSKDHFRKTIAECERILYQLPETPYTTAEACYFLGFCHNRLGQWAKAREYYQSVVSNWPDFEYAWNAQFQIGRCYEELAKADLVSESEAAPIIKAAYQQLLEKYPACKPAEHARYWLSRHNSQ